MNSSSTLVLTYTHLPIQGGARFGALSRDRGGHLSAGHHQAHRAPHARVRGVRVPVRRDRAGRRAGASLRLAARGVLGGVSSSRHICDERTARGTVQTPQSPGGQRVYRYKHKNETGQSDDCAARTPHCTTLCDCWVLMGGGDVAGVRAGKAGLGI